MDPGFDIGQRSKRLTRDINSLDELRRDCDTILGCPDQHRVLADIGDDRDLRLRLRGRRLALGLLLHPLLLLLHLNLLGRERHRVLFFDSQELFEQPLGLLRRDVPQFELRRQRVTTGGISFLSEQFGDLPQVHRRIHRLDPVGRGECRQPPVDADHRLELFGQLLRGEPTDVEQGPYETVGGQPRQLTLIDPPYQRRVDRRGLHDRQSAVDLQDRIASRQQVTIE